ncbi:MAG: tRNA (adenosine(37)-N6)-threonylcarbamoyltransferase complex ATPase subunit type 1 TsaE [Patescibacteria group bacterium]
MDHGPEEFASEARRFARALTPHPEHATVVVLSGELGAGKTTFVQEMATALGVAETVTSPTFVLEKIYQLKGQKFPHLIHIDAYRLKGAHELEALGWKELLQNVGNLIVLEWPERVADRVPEDAIRITLTGSGDTRKISYGSKET